MSWLSNIVGAVFGGGGGDNVQATSQNDVYVETNPTTVVDIEFDLDALGVSFERSLDDAGERIGRSVKELAVNGAFLLTAITAANLIARG